MLQTLCEQWKLSIHKCLTLLGGAQKAAELLQRFGRVWGRNIISALAPHMKRRDKAALAGPAHSFVQPLAGGINNRGCVRITLKKGRITSDSVF